jgi:energy-coupling factor transporter ATP-binding protein EcfA2
MLENIKIKNFRSVEESEVTLAPLTVMFGPTASGKSTLLYAFYILRNFVLNPVQTLDSFFNLGFQSLGGFDACVFNHETKREISVSVGVRSGDQSARYGAALEKVGSKVFLDFHSQLDGFSMRADISLPYPLNQTLSGDCRYKGKDYKVNWNGVTAMVVPGPEADPSLSQELAVGLNAPVEALKKVDFAPHRRGFFKASYAPVPVTPTPTTEDEVATLIINDPNLPSRISLDTEDIFARDFRTQTPPGTATVYFLTTPKKARTPVYLVNDGFGVNQVVYILAKVHRADIETLLIEEPEIHLHPTAIRSLARALCRLVTEEKKQLILSTHSEQFVVSLLTCVAEGIVDPAMIKCYHVVQEKRVTHFHEQQVTKEGQLEGGLGSFIEAEVQDLKKFLSIAQ